METARSCQSCQSAGKPGPAYCRGGGEGRYQGRVCVVRHPDRIPNSWDSEIRVYDRS
jgi:hypothetical protein